MFNLNNRKQLNIYLMLMENNMRFKCVSKEVTTKFPQ